MELGMIGLGRMGSNMAQRLLNGGHQVVAYDPVDAAVAIVAEQGAIPTSSLASYISLANLLITSNLGVNGLVLSVIKLPPSLTKIKFFMILLYWYHL